MAKEEGGDSVALMLKVGVLLIVLAALGLGWAVWQAQDEAESHPLLIEEGTPTPRQREAPFSEESIDEVLGLESKPAVGGINFTEATPISGDPLTIRIDGIGAVSIEKYDRQGNPTGTPLKPGTKVQIPDPGNPGEKIYFTVP